MGIELKNRGTERQILEFVGGKGKFVKGIDSCYIELLYYFSISAVAVTVCGAISGGTSASESPSIISGSWVSHADE